MTEPYNVAQSILVNPQKTDLNSLLTPYSLWQTARILVGNYRQTRVKLLTTKVKRMEGYTSIIHPSQNTEE
jgi:hypothetical protein